MNNGSKDSRVYVVEVKGQPSRLVRATHPLNAIRYVTETLLSVRHASQDDLIALMSKGVTVEGCANEDPQGQLLQEPALTP